MEARRKLTYAEYELLPHEGGRHELLDGFHVAEPPPATYHQTLSRRIQFQLYTQIELTGRGQVFDAPVAVQLSENDVVEPDLVVVLEESRSIIQRTKIDGVPELVVEILSESTASRDRGAKKELYARSGIAEYWIVDPDAHVVEQYVLAKGGYSLAGKHADAIASHRVSGVSVDLTEVW